MDGTVTIQQLNVQFDVEGESQDAVFAALFHRHIREWSRRERDRCERERNASASRSLGDQGGREY
jgi:hypothetical protein